jgi:hypothetical protein
MCCLLACFAAAALATTNSGTPKVLSFGAANSWVNWTAVEVHSEGAWTIDFADLTGFGDTMRNNDEGFQAALDRFEKDMELAIRRLNPSALVVASKGLNILTHLASKGIYTGPAVLLSPIPNECDHIHGTTWEEQWTNSLKVLVETQVGPIAVGVGTSTDEKDLIVDMMNQTQLCGDLQEGVIGGPMLFARCPDWSLRSFPGGHGWKGDPANAIHIASLIDKVLRIEQLSVQQGKSEL